MEPEHLRFGGGATETILTPFTAVWMLIAIVLILVLPRHKVIVAFLFSCLTIPIGQVVVLGTLHFTVLRILIIAGLIRRATEGSRVGKYPGGFNDIDRVVVLWTVSLEAVLSLQWMDSQMFIHNLGDWLDALGGFLVVRFLINDRKAIRSTVIAFALICTVQGVCMISEQVTHVNIFTAMGGMPFTVRDDKIRSQGSMGCLYAGVFGGAVAPLFLWLWTTRESRLAAIAGFVGGIAMTITSNSSSSLMGLLGSVVALLFWVLRKQMRLVRWALNMTLIALHLVMKAPVWALIAHIDLTGSSSSDHRYKLVDNCIRHFGDWWLLGYKYYDQWGYDMWDLSDQFVATALTGGLLSLILYIAIFSRSFGAIGAARKQVDGNRKDEWLLWCLGAVLFGNVVAHFGINYMAQMMMTLFPLLACISAAAAEARQTARNAEGPDNDQRESAPGFAEAVSWAGA